MKKNHFLLVFVSLALGSCASFIYRLHDIRKLDKETILLYSEKVGIPAVDNFVLDTIYSRFINSPDTLRHRSEHKNHDQPLQALYYDKQGVLNTFIINSYARGLPNLKWNRGGILNTFLPKKQVPPDSTLSLFEHLKYSKPLPGLKDSLLEKTIIQL